MWRHEGRCVVIHCQRDILAFSRGLYIGKVGLQHAVDKLRTRAPRSPSVTQATRSFSAATAFATATDAAAVSTLQRGVQGPLALFTLSGGPSLRPY